MRSNNMTTAGDDFKNKKPSCR